MLAYFFVWPVRVGATLIMTDLNNYTTTKIPTLMRVRRTWAVRGTCRVILECHEPDLGAIGWWIGVFCSST